MPPAFPEKYLTFSDKFPVGLSTDEKFPAIFTGCASCLILGENGMLFCAGFPENNIDKTLTKRYTVHSEIVK